MPRSVKNFIADLRNAEEKTRKRWLAVFSAASAVVVIGLWLPYMNYSISSLSGDQPESGGGFWRAARAGAAVVYEQARASVSNWRPGFSRSVNIDSRDFNFTPKKLLKVPEADLPASGF